MISCGPCICNKYLSYWQGRCSCNADEQGCRGGIFYPVSNCERYVEYTGSRVETCLKANVQVFQDGYISAASSTITDVRDAMRNLKGATNMWVTVGSEMWNLDNAEGIVVEDNRVIIVFPGHNEKFEAESGVDAESVQVDIEVAINSGQKIFSGLPHHLNVRDDDVIYNRFG